LNKTRFLCTNSRFSAQLSDDKSGLEAIRALHQQLDDDANGNVDLSESDEVPPPTKGCCPKC
jgi:hypothetical protein